MALDSNARETIHTIVARFVPASLPNAKLPYNLKAEFQPELDVRGVANKAEVYNIGTDAKVIEDGVNAFIELAFCLAADGYKIKTPLFNLNMRLPGEYSGDETGLKDGLFPEARISAAAPFRKFIKEKVRLSVAGIDADNGHIGETLNETSGSSDESAAIGDLLVIYGHGLKIEADEAHRDTAGLYFVSADGSARIKAAVIAVNEPRTLKVIVPYGLTVGTAYYLEVITQSSAKHSGHLLKEPRTVRSDFTLQIVSP